jgi:hypothetical protein
MKTILIQKGFEIGGLEKWKTVPAKKTCLRCNFDYNGRGCPKCGYYKFKPKRLSLWQKIKLFFGWCPLHGGWLFHWEFGKWKCEKGKETWYA